MDREARVALEVQRLERLPHRADPQLAVLELGTSVPEMRGEPSLRSVAIVLCLWASKRSLTRSASSGAAAANRTR